MALAVIEKSPSLRGCFVHKLFLWDLAFNTFLQEWLLRRGSTAQPLYKKINVQPFSRHLKYILEANATLIDIIIDKCAQSLSLSCGPTVYTVTDSGG